MKDLKKASELLENLDHLRKQSLSEVTKYDVAACWDCGW